MWGDGMAEGRSLSPCPSYAETIGPLGFAARNVAHTYTPAHIHARTPGHARTYAHIRTRTHTRARTETRRPPPTAGALRPKIRTRIFRFGTKGLITKSGPLINPLESKR